MTYNCDVVIVGGGSCGLRRLEAYVTRKKRHIEQNEHAAPTIEIEFGCAEPPERVRSKILVQFCGAMTLNLNRTDFLAGAEYPEEKCAAGQGFEYRPNLPFAR